MKFWTSKIPNEEKNWSVILNPLRSELDKKRVAEKISELFRLSFEEARELVQSTPLILLDELPHEVALQVQNIFQRLRAEVTLTSDRFTKRRCYRAIWPEPPQLSFLDRRASDVESEKSGEESPMETRPQATAPAAVVEGEREALSDSSVSWEKRYRELEVLYEERTQEVEELKRSFDKMLKERTEKNAGQVQATLQDWEERYQSLKEEHQESKAIYEEKILLQEKEFEVLKEKLQELELWQEKATHLEKQNQGLLEKLDHLETVQRPLEQSIKEQTEAVNLWREKYQGLAQKSERLEALYEEERKRRGEAEESRRQVSESAERARQDIDTQRAETERWRKKVQELDESQKHLEEEFSRASTEQNSEIRRLREMNHELTMQLESAQRQARDLLFRVETQELVEKRTRLANELASKEARLRELALEGERLRQEIQDRELRAQTLAGEQSTLEREVLEVKQTQRHLLEQSKMKEKNNKFRRTAKLGGDELGDGS